MKTALIIGNMLMSWLILVFVYFRIKQINKTIKNIHLNNEIPKQCRNVFIILTLLTVIFVCILNIFIAYIL